MNLLGFFPCFPCRPWLKNNAAGQAQDWWTTRDIRENRWVIIPSGNGKRAIDARILFEIRRWDRCPDRADSANGQDYGVFSDTKIHGAWYHVASVYDRQSLKIYVNGVLEGVASVVNVTPYMGGAPLRIGNIRGSTHANAGVFDGAIDDIRIYNHALNQSDIDSLYGTPNVVPEPSSMLIGTLLGLGGLLSKRMKK